MQINVISLFPQFLNAITQFSKVKKAIELKQLKLNFINLREFGVGNHQITDDYAFGASKGMVLKPEPLFFALQSVQKKQPSYNIVLSPQGRLWDQSIAHDLIKNNQTITLIAGHYDGIDERINHFVDDKISIGNFVTCGGETPAMLIIDTISRLLPGVINPKSKVTDSFYQSQNLSYPVYTRPREFKDLNVPPVLISGHLQKILFYEQTHVLKNTLKHYFNQLKRTKNLYQDLLTQCQSHYQAMFDLNFSSDLSKILIKNIKKSLQLQNLIEIIFELFSLKESKLTINNSSVSQKVIFHLKPKKNVINNQNADNFIYKFSFKEEKKFQELKLSTKTTIEFLENIF